MPPAFVARSGAVVETPNWGPVRYDLCYGGVFYALVDVDQVGMMIAPNNARALAISGVEIRDLIAARTEIAHPDAPEVNGLAYVMFRSEEPDGAIRTCTTLKPARVDRSPCGTGSNSNMALRNAEGRLSRGHKVVSRSIIGGEFTTEFLGEEMVGPYIAARNRVSGQCWIYGISQVGLDPTDPFADGFTLSDTWGGCA
jgi:proline racemase